MTEAMKQSRVEFSRLEIGVLPNPRAELTHVRELAEDIKQRGLLVPLLVWHKRLKREQYALPDGRSVWDRYCVLGGHRRYAAILLIREEDPTAFEQVPVVLFEGTESDAVFAAIADNLSREDLTVVDLAEAVHGLKVRGHPQAEIAKRLGKSQAWVSRLLKFRENACEALRKAVADDAVPFDLALTLCELDEAAQKRTLAHYLDAKKTDGKAAAGKAARGEAGAVVRPSAKVLAREHEFLATARKQAPKEQQIMLSLAERVLAYALGKGPWPSELPRPEPSAKDASKSKWS